MLTWLSDPIVRSAMRHSVGWIRLVPVVPVILIELESSGNTRLARLGLFALCYAAPQAASYLLEMEHDGRLDQIRLSGRRPTTVVAVALAGVAGPWLVIGVVLTILALLRAEAPLLTLAAIAAVAGVPTTLAALSTTVRFARERIDPRIGMAALSFMSMATAIVGGGAFNALYGMFPTFGSALVVETAIIVYCLRGLPRRIAHPPTRDNARSARFRLPASEWILRWPGIYRGACLSSNGFILFFLFAPMGIMGWILSDRIEPLHVVAAALYLSPLFVGLIAVSLICREDAMAGRLDLVRQSSRPVAVTALEMLIGLWAPFVGASVALALLAEVLFGVTPDGLRFALFALILVAPLPLIEGWSRLWPMMHVAPFGIAAAILMLLESWPAIGVVSVVYWVAASRMLFHPDRATLSGWPGLAATSAVCAVPMLMTSLADPFLPGISVAIALFALSPVLIDPGSESRLDRLAQPLAILLIIFLAGTLRSGVEGAAASALLALVLWFAARRSRQWNPSRPLVQATARLVALVLGVQFVDLLIVPRLDATPGVVQWPAVLLTSAIALALAAEVIFRIATFVAKRRSIPLA